MNRLKEIRKEFNLSQKELGQKIGKKANTICEIEQERYPIKKTTALAIEAVLGINAEWLLTGNGDKYKKATTVSTHLKDSPIISTSPEDISRKEIIKIIDDFWTNAISEEKIWLKVELKRFSNLIRHGSMDNE